MQKKPLAISVLLVISVVFSLAVAEMLARASSSTDPTQRRLMFSVPPFQLDSNGAVRYVPNRTIRTLALYDRKIEFDVSIRTNNLGFLDDIDYFPTSGVNERRYAIVGDSFTACDGDKPWIPRLRAMIAQPTIKFYNLGVSGTSIEHFYRLLKSVTAEIDFTDIVIVAISDDFKRPFWEPHVDQDQLRFCAEDLGGDCAKQPRIASLIGENASYEAITDACERTDVELAGQGNKLKSVLTRSRLVTLGVRAYGRLKSRNRLGEITESNLAFLFRIQREFPRASVYLVHVPQKSEVRKDEYQLDIERRVLGSGIEYFAALRACKWTTGMYYMHDEHPNRSGYENLCKCIAELLFQKTAQKGKGGQ
jgi:hypothetical protein